MLDWWLILAPAIFLAGWAYGRVDLRQLVKIARQTPQSTVAAFARLRSGNRSEAAELLLGEDQLSAENAGFRFEAASLLREAGDYPRAIAIHKQLRSFEGIDDAMRARASYELGLDYFKAGFFNLAETCFGQVGGSEFAEAATEKLLLIHFRTRSWKSAIDDFSKMEKAKPGFEHARNILAHLYCEWASEYDQASEQRMAKLDDALQADAQCARAMLMRGDHALASDDAAAALQHWQPVFGFTGLLFLLPERLLAAYEALGKVQEGVGRVRQLLESNPSRMLLVHACAALRTKAGKAATVQIADAALSASGGITAVREWLLAHAHENDNQGEYAALLAALPGADMLMQCSNCGHRASEHSWQCAQCLKWDCMTSIDILLPAAG